MTRLTSKQLVNFFKKAERFFNSNYPILKDINGMPTEVKTEKTSYSLIHAIDRMYLTQSITQDLIKVMYFDSDEASELALYYVDLKYREYSKYIMNL